MKKTEQRMKKIDDTKFNPLADYPSQVENKSRINSRRLGDTSLKDDVRPGFAGLNDNTEISFSQEVGNFEYTKLILSAVNRRAILSMPPSAISLFIWICFQLEYLSDTVIIEQKEIAKSDLKMAVATFNKAIEELEKQKIIKRIGKKRTEEYWHFHINPQIFFRGDAKNFYKDVLHKHPDYDTRNTNIQTKDEV